MPPNKPPPDTQTPTTDILRRLGVIEETMRTDRREALDKTMAFAAGVAVGGATTDDPVAEIDALHDEAAAVTADTCEAKPIAEPVAGVTMADAEAVLRKVKFTPEWIYSSGHHEIFVSTARILYGQMLTNERRLQKQAKAILEESKRRAYYQSLANRVRLIVEEWSGEAYIGCGTAEHPSTELVDAVRGMARVARRVTTEPYTGGCEPCDGDDDLPSNINVTIAELPEFTGHYVRSDEPSPIIPALRTGLEARVKVKWPIVSWHRHSDGTFTVRYGAFDVILVGPVSWSEVVAYFEANAPELPVDAAEAEAVEARDGRAAWCADCQFAKQVAACTTCGCPQPTGYIRET